MQVWDSQNMSHTQLQLCMVISTTLRHITKIACSKLSYCTNSMYYIQVRWHHTLLCMQLQHKFQAATSIAARLEVYPAPKVGDMLEQKHTIQYFLLLHTSCNMDSLRSWHAFAMYVWCVAVNMVAREGIHGT